MIENTLGFDLPEKDNKFLESGISNRDHVRTEFFNGVVQDSHNFQVTDTDFQIDSKGMMQLKTIASLIPNIVNGMYRITKIPLINDRTRRKITLFRDLRNVFGQGKLYESIMQGFSGNIPDYNKESEEILLHEVTSDYAFTKVDLVRAKCGDFKIVEIEPGKSHGFGYTTLGRNLATGSKIGYGLESYITAVSAERNTALILSGSAEYYELEAEYFARQVRKAGGLFTILPQCNLMLREDGLYHSKNLHQQIEQVIGIPRLQESNKGVYANVSALVSGIEDLILNGRLINLTQKDDLLSEKAMLGIISNPQEDELLENLIERAFGKEVLLVFRQYLPRTEALDVSRRHLKAKDAIIAESDSYFVKVSRSSGAHGVVIPGDKERQTAMIKPKNNVIIQEKIEPAFHRFNNEDVKTGARGEGEFCMRYVLFVDNLGRIMDLALTASPGIIAHGGSKSILIAPSISL